MNNQNQETTFCQHCSCNFNPPELNSCVICGYSLKNPHRSTEYYLTQQSKPRLSAKLIALLALFSLSVTALLGSGIFMWQRLEQRISQLDGANLQPQPPKRLAADSRIKIYRRMEKVPNVPKGLFNYNGATSFAALNANGLTKEISLSHPEYQVRYTEPSLNARPGGATGIRMLLDGELTFALSGRPIKDVEYAKAKSRNFNLEQVPVAIDGVAFFVNPQLPVAALSIEQLKDVFQGKITNWKELGGLDLPIIPVSQDPDVHVTVSLLLNNGEQLGKDVKIVRDYTTAMQQVAENPGAISFSPASLVRNQQSIRSIGLAKGDSRQYIFPIDNGQINLQALRNGSYPITRRMYVVVRRDRTIEEQAGIAYANLLLTNQGQQIIKEAGFVPLY